MSQVNLKVFPISEERFASMREEWNSLLVASATENVFLTWEWVHAWWNRFKAGKKLCILAVKDGNHMDGIAPFYFENGVGGVRFLKFCGAEELYPDYLDLVAAHGKEQAVVEAIACWLANNPSYWDVLSFDHLLESAVLARLKSILGGQFVTDWTETSRCPHIKINGSFDEYMKTQFKRKKRYNLERQVKILLEDKGCVFKKAEAKVDWDAELDKLFHLHAKRSSEKGIESSFDSQSVKAFHKDFARLMNDQGILELRFLLNNREPVSSTYGFRYKDKFFFYQSGLDPEWQKLSAGTVLLTLSIKQAFSDGLKEFDFLKGNEAYKLSWMTGERIQYRVQFFNKTIKGRAYGQWCRLKNYLKRKRQISASGDSSVVV